MAVRHSTPRPRRSLPTRKPSSKPHSFVQRIAWDAIEIDECLRELRRYFKRLEEAARASRRLGNKIYWKIREEERRR